MCQIAIFNGSSFATHKQPANKERNPMNEKGKHFNVNWFTITPQKTSTKKVGSPARMRSIALPQHSWLIARRKIPIWASPNGPKKIIIVESYSFPSGKYVCLFFPSRSRIRLCRRISFPVQRLKDTPNAVQARARLLPETTTKGGKQKFDIWYLVPGKYLPIQNVYSEIRGPFQSVFTVLVFCFAH